jgi:Rho-binding antiterminator
MAYRPIQCQDYDYIEIACMRHYTLAIELLDGSKLIGEAQTTLIKDKQEFLILEGDQSIRLDRIKTITTFDDDAEFTSIEISK